MKAKDFIQGIVEEEITLLCGRRQFERIAVSISLRTSIFMIQGVSLPD